MTTSRYDHYSFPEEGIELPAVPGRHFQAVKDAVEDAFTRERVVSCEARLAYLVNRKGFADYQSVVGGRDGYRADDNDDDVVIQISVRISGIDINRGVVRGLGSLIDTLRDEDKEAKIAAAKEAALKAKEAYEASLSSLEELGGCL